MIILLYGPDSWRCNQKLQQLKEKFTTAQSGQPPFLISAVDLNFVKFKETLSAGSLFAQKQMVIVQDLFSSVKADELTKIFEYLKTDQAEPNVLVLIEPRLIIKQKGRLSALPLLQPAASAGAATEAKPLTQAQTKFWQWLSGLPYNQYFGWLTNAQMLQWLQGRLQAAALTIDYQTLQLLAGWLGHDLWQAANELNKLIHYAQAQGQTSVSRQSVDLLFAGSMEQNIFALTDALSNKNKAQAVKCLHEQLQSGVAEYYLATMLARQLRILLQIRQALDSGLSSQKIGGLLKLHPFVLQKGLNQARNFNLTTLRRLFNLLISLDYQYKSGRINAVTMLDLLVAKV